MMTGKDLLLIAAAGVCLAGGFAHFRGTRPVIPDAPRWEAAAVAVARPAQIPARPFGVSSATLAPEQPLADAFASLLAADPEDDAAHAAALLVRLCQAGKFSDAFCLARQAPVQLQTGFYQLVFNRWAQKQPQDAVRALTEITDAGAHEAACRAAADGWNMNDPAGLAAYTYALSPGRERDYALGVALANWSLQDPTALSVWLDTLPPGSEFDAGAALMIARTDAANRTPEVALQWVENIGDPGLKETSLERVVTEWAQTDAAAARQYVDQAAWLEDSWRAKILDRLAQGR
jgi:hypothetical protein